MSGGEIWAMEVVTASETAVSARLCAPLLGREAVTVVLSLDGEEVAAAAVDQESVPGYLCVSVSSSPGMWHSLSLAKR